MGFSYQEKQELIAELASSLAGEAEVVKVVVFGSFLKSDEPCDLDVAVFQDSHEAYLPLALKYRRKTRHLARRIALDIIPLRCGIQGNRMLDEITRGRTIYERRG